jgi:hypothetical protein
MIGFLAVCSILVLAMFPLSCAVDRPSGLIQTAPLPAKISLSGTTFESLIKINETKVKLGFYREWNLKNIGHYASWATEIDQPANESEGVPSKLLKFAEEEPKAMESIGNDREKLKGLDNEVFRVGNETFSNSSDSIPVY